jgi:uncharacterized protein (DUF2267 family)
MTNDKLKAMQSDDDRCLFRVKNEVFVAKTGFDLEREQVVKAVFSATKDKRSKERIQEVAQDLPGRVRELWDEA